MALHVKISNDGKFAIKMRKGHIRLTLSTENFSLAFAYIFLPILKEKKKQNSRLCSKKLVSDNTCKKFKKN